MQLIQMSLLDLPDDCLRNVIGYLDFPDRFNFRVNRKLEGLVFAETKLDKIDIEARIVLKFYLLYHASMTQVIISQNSIHSHILSIVWLSSIE